MTRAAVLLAVAACVPVSLTNRTYLCDEARPCSAGFKCDCGICVACQGTGCASCPLDTGALSWWKLDSIDAGVAIDCSGNGADGALEGSAAQVQLVEGHQGKAWMSDVTAIDFDTFGAKSTCFLVGQAPRDGVIYEDGVMPMSPRLQLALDANALRLSVNGTQVHMMPVAPPPNGFLPVCLTTDAQLQLWLDGRSAFAMKAPPPRNLDYARLTPLRPIDDVRRYARELTADEVLAISVGACVP